MADIDAPIGLTPEIPWQRTFRKATTSLEALRRAGAVDVPPSQDKALTAGLDVRVPAAWADRWQNIPALARQVIPDSRELIFYPEEQDDPIGDHRHAAVPGIIHRYPDRLLLTLNHHCALYCRFCFRRDSVSHRPLLSVHDLRRAMDYIADHKEIWEVILTGGDPLVLPDATLFRALEALAAQPHIAVIRFHTRVPSALPERITKELVAGLSQLSRSSGKQIWTVVHMNSHHEFAPAVNVGLARLREAGLPLLSQSVLLAGVNDGPGQLEELFRGMVRRGVKPYYLHLPDLARGTHHFRVPLERALTIFESLRGRLPGTCLPTLILDIPGGHGKIDAASRRLRHLGDDLWQAESPLTGHWIDLRWPS